MKFAVLPQTGRGAPADAIIRAAMAAGELGLHATSVHDHIQFSGWGSRRDSERSATARARTDVSRRA